jgi:UvrD-like helicase C-terminal domain
LQRIKLQVCRSSEKSLADRIIAEADCAPGRVIWLRTFVTAGEMRHPRLCGLRTPRRPATSSTHPHLDYGYAVTSHSSQGQTADRVLVHIDMDRTGEQLVNRRLAYVAISRGRYDVQIYTNDKTQLAAALDRDVSHRAAIEPTRTPAAPTQTIERAPTHQHGIGFGI